VHDSNGARPFIRECVEQVRTRLPQAKLEARLDSAFFDEKLLVALALEHVEFTVTVPFRAFAKLKTIVEQRRRWDRIDDTWSYFECDWKPESWLVGFRILVLRQKKRNRPRGHCNWTCLNLRAISTNTKRSSLGKTPAPKR